MFTKSSYTDVVNHLPQFATLMAIGFTGLFLLESSSPKGIILSLLGFWPGLLMAHALAWLAQQATLLPVTITLSNTVGVLVRSHRHVCLGSIHRGAQDNAG